MVAMENHRSARRVLRESETYEKIEELAQKREWAIMSEDQADVEKGTPAETAWRVVRGVLFHLYRDIITGELYYCLSGWDVQKVEQCAEELDRLVSSWSVDDILTALEEQGGDSPSRGRMLMILGLSAPYEFDARVFAVVLRAFSDELADIRNVALFACTYSPWREYRPLVEKIHDEDPSAELRGTAGAVLRAFDSGGVS